MEKTKFRGYSSTVGVFIVLFINLGVASTIGVFLPELAKATDSSVTLLALTVTVATLAAFVATFFLPKIVGKIGGKGTLYVALLFFIPYALFSAFATAPWMVFAHGFLGGFILCFGTLAVSAIIISKWFIKKRSAVLGIVLGGGAFGAAAFQFLSGILIAAFPGSVTEPYLILMAIAVIVPGLANLLLIRDPDKIGQKPLGYEETLQDSAASSATSDTELPGVTFRSAQKSLSFWLCMIAIFVCGPLITGFTTYGKAYWVSYGMPGGEATMWVSVFSAVGCLAVIILGQVANKWGNKLFITIINICYIIGMIFAILWPGNQTIAFVILAVLFVGLAYPVTTSVPATLCTESFGPKDYAKILSWLTAASYLGKAAAAPLISSIVEASGGSYIEAFVVLAIMAAVSLVLILIAIVASPYQKILREKKTKA